MTWLRRVLHAEGPNGTAHERTIEENAITAHHGELYTLYQLRWDDGRERTVAYLGGWSKGIGPSIADVIDLLTGEEFEVSSKDADVAARKLRVQDLAAPLPALWPRTALGKVIPPGFGDNRRNVDPTELRAIAKQAAALNAPPAADGSSPFGGPWHRKCTTCGAEIGAENHQCPPGAQPLPYRRPSDAEGATTMPTKTAAAGEQIVEILLADIHAAQDNPRRSVGDVTELADSIKAVGVLEPLVVVADTIGYTAVLGHRRHKAAKLAGLKTVPAIVREYTDEERVSVMLVENLQREDLSPFEEAHGFKQLEQLGKSQRDIAAAVGKSQSHVAKRLALLGLPDDVVKKVDSGGISITDAYELTRLGKDANLISAVAKKKGQNSYQAMGTLVDSELKLKEFRDRGEANKAKLRKDGVAIVDSYGYRYQKGTPVELGANWGQIDIDKEAHRKLDCSAAAIGQSGEIIWVCTKPANHPEKKEAGVIARPRETKAEREARIERERIEAEEEAARKSRAAFLQELAPGKGTAEDLLRLLLAGQIFEWYDANLTPVATAMGIKPPAPEGEDDDYDRVQHEIIAALRDPRALVRAAAMMLADSAPFTLYIDFYEDHPDRGNYTIDEAIEAERYLLGAEFLERQGFKRTAAEEARYQGAHGVIGAFPTKAAPSVAQRRADAKVEEDPPKHRKKASVAGVVEETLMQEIEQASAQGALA